MADFEKRKIGGDDVRIDRQQTPSKGKVAYIEIDDEVTTAFDRVKRMRSDEVFLIIPKKAVLLQSVVNLKILKKKTSELGKTITIITNDYMGKKLAEQSGIPVFEKFPSAGEEKTEAGGPASKPISMSQAKAPESPFRPTRLPERKLRITELLRKGAEAKDPLIQKIAAWLRKRKKKKKYMTEISIVTPSKPALITLVTLTVFLFVGIAYIALPGATIYLLPASSRIEQPVNVTLLDYEKNASELSSHVPQIIASFRIAPPEITKILSFPATGKQFQGQNASGKITIFNESTHPWPLVTQTRFQTEDGLVFRIQQPITVPRAKAGATGTLEAIVTADSFDASGQIIGGRGNIGPARFFLPGLKNPENRKMMYALNKEPFSGGVTKVIKSVSEDDIKAAREMAKKEISATAKDELKNFLAAQNAERHTSLTLMTDPRTVILSEPKTEIVGSPQGKEIETFEVKASVEISGVAVNMGELLNVMKNEMEMRKTPEKKIVSIVEDSLTYRIFEIDHDKGKIRLTATLRGIEQYDLNPESETGEALIKKIKDHIAGKNIDDATFYMQNLPEIDRVEIKSWPFWAPTLPTVPDNMEFLVKSENSVEAGAEK